MPEYSNRLGHISTEQFQAALTRLHLGEFVEAEPVPFGLFGQNVFLTSTQGRFVLRGAPHYPWQFPTEQFFVDQLHAHTQAPVPYPYLLDPSTDIFGWSFVIMPRMPGLQLHHKLAAARLALKDQLEIAAALARMLVEVQNLTWVVAGKFDPQTGDVMPFDKPYHEWVIDNIHEKLPLRKLTMITPPPPTWIGSQAWLTQAGLFCHRPVYRVWYWAIMALTIHPSSTAKAPGT